MFLHENKVIHRDLSHHNVLIDNKDDVKICDFGLSKKMKKTNSKFITFCGKDNYIAPEIDKK